MMYMLCFFDSAVTEDQQRADGLGDLSLFICPFIDFHFKAPLELILYRMDKAGIRYLWADANMLYRHKLYIFCMPLTAC